MAPAKQRARLLSLAAFWVSTLASPVTAEPSFDPNEVAILDPAYPDQFELENLRWAGAHLGGWEGNNVRIAFLSPHTQHSSIDCTDPRIASRLWVNPGEVLNGIDDDGNGCIDDIHGCNFGHAGPQPWKIGDGLVCFGDNGEEAVEPALPVNHDVGVAGNAVSPIDGEGRVGASPAADLVVLVGELTPEEFRDRVIPYLASIGSRILLTPYSAGPLDGAACQQFTNAWLNGAGQPIFAQPESPIWLFGFPDEWPMCQPEALGVVAIEPDDSTLPPNVEARMPANGVDIAIPAEFQSAALGTAAGVLALLLGQEPALPIDEIKSRLAVSADAVGPLPYDASGWNSRYGYGRANVFRMLHLGDFDRDSVPGDGDESGTIGDTPCAPGMTVDCDDNCPATPNPSQADAGGIGSALADGIGDACQCGDVNGDGRVDGLDPYHVRELLADTAPPVARPELCGVGGDPDACGLLESVRLRRAIEGLTPTLGMACRAALP